MASITRDNTFYVLTKVGEALNKAFIILRINLWLSLVMSTKQLIYCFNDTHNTYELHLILKILNILHRNYGAQNLYCWVKIFKLNSALAMDIPHIDWLKWV